MTAQHHCPDCPGEVPLVPVKVEQDSGKAAVGFKAMASDASYSLWRGYSSSYIGVVHGFLCETCHRVLFYMLSEEESDSLFADAKPAADA